MPQLAHICTRGRIDYTYPGEQSYKYKVGDLVLIKQEFHRKYGSPSYLGPYTVTEVRENGTLRINNGVVTDTYNIHNVQPYRT